MAEEKVRQTEVLVVGTGIAGCAAALAAAKKGVRVLLVTKDRDITKSATALAQGGIISRGSGDSAALLVEDILAAGDGLSRREAAEILAEEGPLLVEKILQEEAGVEFSRLDGKLDFTREAAHSVSRILHKNDHTGEEIETKLTRLVEEREHIEILADHTLVDLLAFPEDARDLRERYGKRRCVGARLLDNAARETRIVLAKKVILATGGIGRVYQRTTNPETAGGDGLAAASRAGAEIINAEFVQFHPTALAVPGLDNFLISESVRGEGAELVNEKGEKFMDRIDKRGSLAPRDVVARGVYEEIAKSRCGCVYLDLRSYLAPALIRQRFPLISETCLGQGIDITRELIPIAPIAHYFCGGIKADERGRTTLANLYAAGEVSCTGLHGANRLASTSLLEGLVWGTRSGEDAAEGCKEEWVKPAAIAQVEEEGKEEADRAQLEQDWTNIRLTMWNSVGIVRRAADLEQAVADLEYLCRRIGKYYAAARPCRALAELRSGAEAALIIARAARDNRESRGCHFRKD